MLHDNQTITNNVLEENLRKLRNPQGLDREQILLLVQNTLKMLGYSGEDIAIFSDSITEKLSSGSTIDKSLFS